MPETKKYLSKIKKDSNVLHIKDTEARKSISTLNSTKLNIADVPEVIDSTEVAAKISEKIVSMSIDDTTGIVSLILDDNTNA